MKNHLASNERANNEKRVEIALRSYASLIASAQELAEAWDSMVEEEQILQRAFVMSDWSKRHELGAFYRTNQLSPTQI
ncbi:MAG: hypothetical protein R3C14_45000 [Caldilineaceae bacterium]